MMMMVMMMMMTLMMMMMMTDGDDDEDDGRDSTGSNYSPLYVSSSCLSWKTAGTQCPSPPTRLLHPEVQSSRCLHVQDSLDLKKGILFFIVIIVYRLLDCLLFDYCLHVIHTSDCLTVYMLYTLLTV